MRELREGGGVIDKPEKMPAEQWDAWQRAVEWEMARLDGATAEYSGNHCHVRADVTVAGEPYITVGATFTGPMTGRVWARPWHRRP